MTEKPVFTIYHNPRCSKSRATLEMLRAHDIELEVIQYLEQHPDFAELQQLAAKIGTDARGIMRPSDELYKALGLDNAELQEQDVFRILEDNPQLLQRPIVVRNGQAVIGRPPENIMQLFDDV